MDHIWTIENWEQNIDLMEEGHRTGFRLRFDSGIIRRFEGHVKSLRHF